jgi:hypothetical protein
LSALVLLGFAASIGRTETTPSITRDAHVERHSSDGPVDVTTHVDRTSAQIADKITLTLTAETPDGVQVFFPEQTDRLGEFDVVDVKEFLGIPIESGRLWRRTYLLESLVSGDLTIPAISVPYSDARSETTNQGSVQTEPINLSVSSLLEGQPDPHKYRDIKDIVDIEPPPTADTRYVLIAAVVTTVLAAGVGTYVLLRRKGRNLSPRAWAMGELQRLQALSANGEVSSAEFYTGVTDVVRHYVEQQFGVAAPRLTTPEFFNRVTSKALLSDQQEQLLREFLATADMVKFAGLSLGAGDACEATERARQFIEDSSANAANEGIREPAKEVA